ncbi:unnamed protein product, partial [Mesorhabditis belari]|uniref:Uncharacterized protein n=1 Tax=Mesorhabditis belari TaxID=2138241 RepID=A0AAF3F539_9BILA
MKSGNTELKLHGKAKHSNSKDQRDKLKQQVDGKTPIEPVNDLTQKLEAEVAKAKALHEQAEEEKNEASFRSTAMSNMVKKTQDRLTSLTKELEAEKEAHARTRAEAALQQAAVQPSSSHPVELPPAPTPVISQSSVIVPSVPTPTSASGTTSTVQHMTETVPHVPSNRSSRHFPINHPHSALPHHLLFLDRRLFSRLKHLQIFCQHHLPLLP